MNASSSGLDALIGGPCVFFAADPPRVANIIPPVNVPRTAIASYESLELAYVLIQRAERGQWARGGFPQFGAAEWD